MKKDLRMNTNKPLISIIIPTYNSEKQISIALRSIVNQSFKDIEVIIMDGLSTDKTVEIAEKYKSKISQLRIFSEKDSGIYDAMNKGVVKANGNWLYFLGSDDYLYEKTTFKNISKYLLTNKYDFVYGNIYSDRFNGEYDGEFNYVKLAKQNICHQAIFFNKKIFNTIGNFNLKYKSHADWDHNIRCFYSSEIKKKFINRIVANYADGGFSSLNFDKVFEKEKKWLLLKRGFNKLPKKSILKIFKSILFNNKLKL